MVFHEAVAGHATSGGAENEEERLCHDPPHYHSLRSPARRWCAPREYLAPLLWDTGRLKATPVKAPQSRRRCGGVVVYALGSSSHHRLDRSGRRARADQHGTAKARFRLHFLFYSARSSPATRVHPLGSSSSPSPSSSNSPSPSSSSRRGYPVPSPSSSINSSMNSSSRRAKSAPASMSPLSPRLPHACA